MSDQSNPHFNQIYIYIILTTIIALGYLFLVTFSVIPEKNWHIVDIAVGFLLGTVVSSGIGYLLGGNPSTSKKNEGITTSTYTENTSSIINTTTILE